MAQRKITPKAPAGDARSTTGTAAGVTKTSARKLQAKKIQGKKLAKKIQGKKLAKKL